MRIGGILPPGAPGAAVTREVEQHIAAADRPASGPARLVRVRLHVAMRLAQLLDGVALNGAALGLRVDAVEAGGVQAEDFGFDLRG